MKSKSMQSLVDLLPADFARQLGSEFMLPSRAVGFLVGATLIVIAGPFGTFDLPFAKRFGFWVSWFTVVWIATTVLFLVSHRSQSLSRAWFSSILAFFFSIPVAAILGVTIAMQFFPNVRFTWYNLVLEAKFLSPIVGCVTILLHMTRMAYPKKPGQTKPELSEPFFARLPHSIGRELICISVSDHYLRIETEAGEAFILGSLSEAVSQLQGFRGCQVHRSYWVAIDAIEERKWLNQNLQLKLKNGASIPVGRTYRPKLLELLSSESA